MRSVRIRSYSGPYFSVHLFSPNVGRYGLVNVPVKLSDPMLSVTLEYFIIKKRNAEFYQYAVPRKSNFYRRLRRLKNLYKICTDDHDNNECLAVKYIRCFTNDMIFVLSMFINEHKQ